MRQTGLIMNKKKEYTAPIAELYKLPITLSLLAGLSQVDGSLDVDDWEVFEENFYKAGKP